MNENGQEDVREKLNSIVSDMSQRYVMRDEELHGLALAALTGHHYLLLGPPGTAKTQMLEEFTGALGGELYSWLLSPFTTPDEVFGPVDIQSLKAGIHRRVTTHKLPEADVAYLDEIFKSSTAILYSMLKVLQERVYHNDGVAIQCPLLFSAASSNELPSKSQGLDALYDRFTLRYVVEDVPFGEPFTRVLTSRGTSSVGKRIEIADIKAVKAGIEKMPVLPEVYDAINTLGLMLAEQGIKASPRRWNQLLDVMAAESWLQGQVEVSADALTAASCILWTRPEERGRVNSSIAASIHPEVWEADQILSAATEAIDRLRGQGSLATQQEKMTLVQELHEMGSKLSGMKQSRKMETRTEKLSSWTAALEYELLQSIRAGAVQA